MHQGITGVKGDHVHIFAMSYDVYLPHPHHHHGRTSNCFAASSEGASRVPMEKMTAFCRAVARGRLTILPLPISNSSPLAGNSVNP